MSATRIKICGLCSVADVAAANETLPDFAGFVIGYPRSARSVSPATTRELAGCLDARVTAVGVFVDQPPQLVADLVNDGTLGAVQLHGDEDAAYVADLRRRMRREALVIQAFCLHGDDDAAAAQASAADLVLLDAGRGAGTTFDWARARLVRRPYLLAGGLTPETIPDAIARLDPWGVDLSSGVETDGRKDIQKMRAAVAAVRSR
ncbi:phosphoribosylanthranilate isomerase [bacterium]|nr:phosphoribosylanthranilate isomerase [bacterium]